MPSFPRWFLLIIGLACGGSPARAADPLQDALDRNDFVAAERELEQLAEDWRKEWEASGDPGQAREYGLTLQALGVVERQAGKAVEAIPHLESAMPLLADADPATRADLREARALALQDVGRLEDAEREFRQLVELRAAGPQDALLQSRDHLALLLLARGRYPEAGDLLRSNLAETPPADAVARARRLGLVARHHHTLGSYSRAATTLREALALDFQDRELRLLLGSQLALAELRLGHIDTARRGLEAAADQARSLHQADGRPFLAVPHLVNLGALDLDQGNPLQARNAFAEALSLLEATLPADHPALIVPLNNLGCAEQATGDLAKAGQHLRRAAELQALHLPRVHLRVAETARNLARNALLAREPSAADEVDRATGIGLELLGELVRHGSERERLNFLQQLDLVSLPCTTGDARRIAAVLTASKARLLDAMLAAASPANPPLSTWQDVQRSLPEHAALIDACRYHDENRSGELRYGAIVLLPAGAPKWVPLGSEEDLQRWLDAFRRRLSWRAGQLAGQSAPAPTLKLRTILQGLHREFWEPLARELPPGTEEIAFSPDGALHFLPLSALLDAEQRPLCARHRQLTTVSSARDLVGGAPPPRLDARPWAVLGVSDFPKSTTPPGDDRLLTLLAELDPMPGTADETDRIRRLAPPRSVFLRDHEATELSLGRLHPSPTVLHLGSHAFFLPHERSSAAPIDFDENAELLFSGGLLLHQAALRGPDSPLLAADDDLLFPAEVARLPLRETRLVTLSSCESGVGTAVSGEGLLGLRRGFALAGAREVVVALWPVSDQSTPAFMERFYQLALAANRPAQALWQTQREFLAPAAAADDGSFEAAVLRYSPFVIGQNTALESSREIVAAPVGAGFPWRILWLGLPLAAFIAARVLGKRAT